MITILLVEDDRMNRMIITRFLTLKGFMVISACDGAAALEMAQTEQPALVLMDMALPILDGWEAVRRMRDNPETQAIPVIALTAFATKEERDRCLAAGCNDFITKPVDFLMLLGRIHALLPAAPRE